MRKVSDLFQLFLSDDGGIGFVAWVIVTVAVLQAGKLFFAGVELIQYFWRKRSVLFFIPNSKAKIALVLTIAFVLYLFRAGLVEQIQYVEQMYIHPTYLVSDSSYWATSCYETELKKRVNQSEFETVRDSTYSLAKELGCEPLAIYEVAFSECGLNPFCVRTDGIAAGWIQFTAVGVRYLGVSLSEVKQWCQTRDAKRMMGLTGKYMRKAANGRTLRTSTDVYCAVFAPGKIGHGEDQALYSGWGNPEYFLNKGLDGYQIRGEKVLFLSSKRDGVLTKNDLTGALAYKKAGLLTKYK